MKQEASGYTDWYKTEEDKVKYITYYYRHKGVQMEDKISIEITV